MKIKLEIAHAMFKFEMMPPPKPVEEAPKPSPKARLFNTAFSLDNLILEEETISLE
jgi:hypothetical protein